MQFLTINTPALAGLNIFNVEGWQAVGGVITALGICWFIGWISFGK